MNCGQEEQKNTIRDDENEKSFSQIFFQEHTIRELKYTDEETKKNSKFSSWETKKKMNIDDPNNKIAR